MSEEKPKPSDEIIDIASELLANGCKNCTYYELKKCDSKTINCCWLKLVNLLQYYEAGGKYDNTKS